MGAAYPLLSSEPFSAGAPAALMGPLVAFAETATVAWVSVGTGGAYSALHARGWDPEGALQIVLAPALLLAAGAALLAARRRRDREAGAGVAFGSG